MLKTRLITAAILLPIVLGLFIYGLSWFVIGFVTLCMTLSIYEAATILVPAFEKRLAPDADRTATKYVFPAITIALGIAMLLISTLSTPEASVGVIALGSLTALLLGAFSSRNMELSAARAFSMLISLTYGALPWICVWHIFLMGANSRYILLVMTVTWAGDTGGYFGGRYYGGKLFGGRKLAPSISPKKTWEGAISGLAMSVVGAIILNLVFLNALAPMSTIVLAALVGGVCAQLGDLVESMFKRFAGVKDSGTIIPGHGGFLDRVDGIMFSAPVIWAIIYYSRP
jgi:phosphatidate cytidylyltransferase